MGEGGWRWFSGNCSEECFRAGPRIKANSESSESGTGSTTFGSRSTNRQSDWRILCSISRGKATVNAGCRWTYLVNQEPDDLLAARFLLLAALSAVAWQRVRQSLWNHTNEFDYTDICVRVSPFSFGPRSVYSCSPVITDVTCFRSILLFGTSRPPAGSLQLLTIRADSTREA